MSKVTPEDIAKAKALADARRRKLANEVAQKWREGLTHKDWLFDGSPINSKYAIERYNQLDWSKAWIDLGPSVVGNLGPYWHVPMNDGDTVHRLYPKVLKTKWALLILHACFQQQTVG